jgi:hypothetical protein
MLGHQETFMRQIRTFSEERNNGWCVYCGGQYETDDHSPSRVLLDKPYPENLPVVPCCRACNDSFSLDEEYLACLIECARTGSAGQGESMRSRIADKLIRTPSLEARLASARIETDDAVYWNVEVKRVRNVIVKLAKAHAAYENSEPMLDPPTRLWINPLCTMTREQREHFEAPINTGVWPEAGSRVLHQIVVAAEGDYDWIEVQPERYRYLVAVGDSVVVRIVISEYLAAEACWD